MSCGAEPSCGIESIWFIKFKLHLYEQGLFLRQEERSAHPGAGGISELAAVSAAEGSEDAEFTDGRTVAFRQSPDSPVAGRTVRGRTDDGRTVGGQYPR